VNENSALTRTTLPALPALVIGRIDHTRREHIHRTFQHNAYQWLLDLDDIPKQPWFLRPFASFSSCDHLGNPQISIRENVANYLAANGIRLDPSSRILMLANARIFGYVFDPLTVFGVWIQAVISFALWLKFATDMDSAICISFTQTNPELPSRRKCFTFRHFLICREATRCDLGYRPKSYPLPLLCSAMRRLPSLQNFKADQFLRRGGRSCVRSFQNLLCLSAFPF
jgi:hypothetical protein